MLGVSRTCELGEVVIFDDMVREALLRTCGLEAAQETGLGYLSIQGRGNHKIPKEIQGVVPSRLME